LADYHRLNIVHGDIKLNNILVKKLERVKSALADPGTMAVLPKGVLMVISR
jgi:serine/threonine protein kinase